MPTLWASGTVKDITTCLYEQTVFYSLGVSRSVWEEVDCKLRRQLSEENQTIGGYLVLATGPGDPPAVQVWTAKTGRFGSRTVQKPNPLNLGGPILHPYPSTRGFRRVWLDPSVPISGSAFRVSYLWSHSDMLLLIVKYWHLYVKVHFRRISCLDVQNKHTHVLNHILKMSVNKSSTEHQQSVNNIWCCNLFCL